MNPRDWQDYKIISSKRFPWIWWNSIFAKEQYGFRNDSSTDRASYILTHEILNALNSKQIAGGIFCDLKNAFDVVNHRNLLKELEHYGFVGKVNVLVKSYLPARYQRIVTQNNNKRRLLRLGNGQTRGTARIYLGSLIFLLLFINYFPLVTSNKNTTLVLYADDTSMFVLALTLYSFRLKQVLLLMT
jgi:hypothetical protein